MQSSTNVSRGVIQPILKGAVAAGILLAVYFAVLTLVSGSSFAANQFSQFWYYITSLATGFGIQIGLYNYLKSEIHAKDPSGKMLAVTGTTSTGAMISCCAHYLVNVLPVLGVSAFASFIGAYQVQFFWVGIAFNLGGIAYMISRIMKFKQHMI